MPEIQANGTTLSFDVYGDGEPLLLLAGLAGDRHAWDHQREAYAERFRCIALDNRGVGRSGKAAGPYTTRLMAADAIAVLDHLAVEAAHVSGQSMGGAIVQQLAAHWPERVWSASIHCSWARSGGYLRDVFASWSAIRRSCTLAEYNRHVLTWILTPQFFDEDPGAVEAIRAGMDDPEVVQPSECFDAQANACAEHNFLEELAAVTAPTLVTVGADDIFTPPALSREIAERIVGAELGVVADAGHCLFWEQAAEFNTVTLDFLERHTHGVITTPPEKGPKS